MRMRGYNVFFPIGHDAFGLPAENAAIKRSIHPKEWTYANIERMDKQLRMMGNSFDWRAELITADPEYYRWTQWWFLQFLEAGLAYQRMSPVDFCPSCNTTLAREQVQGEDRHCERCETPVIRKDLKQWFFRTTAYAEELWITASWIGLSMSRPCSASGLANLKAPTSSSTPKPATRSRSLPPALTLCGA